MRYYFIIDSKLQGNIQLHFINDDIECKPLLSVTTILIHTYS